MDTKQYGPTINEWRPCFRLNLSALEQTSFLQGIEGAIFADSFEGPGRQTNLHKAAEFRHPNAFVAQVGGEGAPHFLDVVQADTALFFGETAVMDAIAAAGAGSCDLTKS